MFKRDDFTPIFEKSGVGYDFNYSIQVMFLVCILFTYLSGCFSGEWHQEAVYRPDLYLPGQDVLYQREEAGDKLPSAANDGGQRGGVRTVLGHHHLPGPAGRQ